MKNLNQGLTPNMLIFLFFSLLLSCTSISVLRVNYRLPPSSDALEGRKIKIVLQDEREKEALLTPQARRAFEGFKGSLSFSVVSSEDGSVGLGLYRPAAVVVEAFKKKLKNEGLKMAVEGSEEALHLVIVLQSFTLDLVGRRWMAELSYEAKAIKDREARAVQSVRAQAERVRIMGTGEADKVMGEVLTDAVNRLNTVRLFRNAGML